MELRILVHPSPKPILMVALNPYKRSPRRSRSNLGNHLLGMGEVLADVAFCKGFKTIFVVARDLV